jgi:peroxiredoxin
VSYNRAVGKLVVLALALAACKPAPPPINPYKAKPRGGPPAVEKEDIVASDGTVRSRAGQELQLASLWQDGRIVVVFIRGHWCPHCQHQLSKLNEARDELAAKGVRRVAVITSDAPEEVDALIVKLALGYVEVYSDAQLAVITKWGVSDHANGIALPATFVVEKGGAISWRKVGAKPTDHPSVADLMQVLSGRLVPRDDPRPVVPRDE